MDLLTNRDFFLLYLLMSYWCSSTLYIPILKMCITTHHDVIIVVYTFLNLWYSIRDSFLNYMQSFHKAQLLPSILQYLLVKSITTARTTVCCWVPALLTNFCRYVSIVHHCTQHETIQQYIHGCYFLKYLCVTGSIKSLPELGFFRLSTSKLFEAKCLDPFTV